MKQLLEYVRNFYRTHNIYRELFEKSGHLTESQAWYRQYLTMALQPSQANDPTAPFKAFIDAKLAAQLEPLDKKADTLQGQEEIINAAGQGDKDCALYLYVNYLGIISKVFHKRLYNVLTKNHSIMVDEDDLNNLTYEMVTIALEMLSGGTPGESEGRHANMYRTFKAEVYTERDQDFNLLHHFGYWFQQYLTDEVTYLLRRYWNQGVTGVPIDQFAPNQASFEGLTAGINHDTDEFVSNRDALSLSTEEDPDTKMLVKQAIEDFERFLSTKPNSDLLITIWRMKYMAQMKPEQISQATGLDKYTIQKISKNLQNWFSARHPRNEFDN